MHIASQRAAAGIRAQQQQLQSSPWVTTTSRLLLQGVGRALQRLLPPGLPLNLRLVDNYIKVCGCMKCLPAVLLATRPAGW
jgi:hypothetical protein